MTLRDTIIDDATAVFANEDDFAETVVYRPRSGGTRSISAVVIRQIAETISDEENRVVPVFEVHVANDSTNGIAADEINRGGDTIDIAERIGQTAKPRPITQILEQDEGMIVLQCR